MKIIISPAKKMNTDDNFSYKDYPLYLDKTQQILDKLHSLSRDELQILWKCSDALARENHQRIQEMDLKKHLTPAIFSYEGIQYQHMAPHIMEESQLDFLQKHLCILSGFYGLVRPFHGVTPYRLEMQGKLQLDSHKNLYSFWGRQLAEQLETESNFILNLASKEYSKAVLPHLSPENTCITCQFGELKEDKLVEKGTMCKMARGEMVRWLAQENQTEKEGIKEFKALDFAFSPERSTETTYVFVKSTASKEGMF